MVSVRRFTNDGAFRAGVTKATGRPIAKHKDWRDDRPIATMVKTYHSRAPITLPKIEFKTKFPEK